MPRKAKSELADDDAPELTAKWFDKARPSSKVLPQLFSKSRAAELLLPKCGRPPLEEKTPTNKPVVRTLN